MASFRRRSFIREGCLIQISLTLWWERLLEKRRLFDYLQYKACVAGVERGRGLGERQKRRAD